MKKFCLVFFILGIVFIGAGSTLALIFTGMGYDIKDLEIDGRRGSLAESTETTVTAYEGDLVQEWSESTFTDGDSYSHYYGSADGLKSISVEVPTADVYVSYGEQLSVYAYNIDPKKFTESISSEGELKIEYSSSVMDVPDGKPSVSVYVPYGTDLLKLDIKSSAGNALIQDIAVNEFEYESSAGELSCNGIKIADETDIEVAAGSIYIYDSSVTDMKLSCAAGSIYADGITLYGSTEIEHISGSLTMNINGDPDDFNFDVNCGLGATMSIEGQHTVPKTAGTRVFKLEKTAGNGEISFYK